MVTYTAPKTSDLMSEVESLRQRFDRFHLKRDLDGLWNKMINRELATELQPELTGMQQGLDFQSPDPEKAVFEHVAILMMNPTRFDIKIGSMSERSQNDARDVLLWLSREWNRINTRRHVDARVAEGQVKQGMKVEWLRYHAVDPKVFDGDNQERSNVFYLDNVLIDGCSWLGDSDNPDVFYYRYTVPVLESQFENEDNGRAYLDEKGEAQWWSGEAEQYPYTTQTGKMFTVIVRDARDPKNRPCPIEGCDHIRRFVSTYICGEYDNVDNAKEVKHIDSPFMDCSFFIIGGRIAHTNRDPDKQFRPMMLPMYVLQAWINYLITLLATLSRGESIDDFYVDLSQTDPRVVSQLNAAYNREGGPNAVIEKPDTDNNEMALLGGTVRRYPKPTSQLLLELIKLALEKMQEYMPNRFMAGTAYSETSNATGTGLLTQTQQAGLQYEPFLTEYDGFIERWARNVLHAIRYWEEYYGDVKMKYPAIVTGEENIMSYADSRKNGEVVYMDARKAAMNFDLIIKTSNVTIAEAGARWLQEKDQYLMGVKTFEDLIKAAGVFDTRLQQRLLLRDKVIKSLEPLYLRMFQLQLTRQAAIESNSILGGVDFSEMLGGDGGDSGQGGDGSGAGSGQSQAANEDAGGNPATSAPQPAPQPNSPTLPPNSIMGRSMQQAVIQSPGGGNSGVEGY